MAPTEGRVAKPERRWDCRRGTPNGKGEQDRREKKEGIKKGGNRKKQGKDRIRGWK